MVGDRAGAAAAAGWTSSWDTSMRRRQTEAEPRSAADLQDADDHVLVTAFLEGRREAFDLIVERHRRQVYHLCYRFAGNHEDASDLAQDVFVRAFRGLARFKGQSAFTTWLYRVGVNTCLNRTATKRPPAEPLDDEAHVDRGAVDPLVAILDEERAMRLRRAVDQLPPKQRATLVLRIYEGLSHEEIASVLGSTVGAAKANFFHALGNLKRLVNP